MNTMTLVSQIGQRANELTAERYAKKDLRWWARRIANAAAQGHTRCDNFGEHANIIYIFNDYWEKRCTKEYASALQSLLPKGFEVNSLRDEDGCIGITISW